MALNLKYFTFAGAAPKSFALYPMVLYIYNSYCPQIDPIERSLILLG